MRVLRTRVSFFGICIFEGTVNGGYSVEPCLLTLLAYLSAHLYLLPVDMLASKEELTAHGRRWTLRRESSAEKNCFDDFYFLNNIKGDDISLRAGPARLGNSSFLG
jgi:hypothetical protein